MDKTITPYAQAIAAQRLATAPELLRVEAVSGGYSLNRRSLVGANSRWLFVKEVDESLLVGDGSEELAWLDKDAKVMAWLRRRGVNCVPEWSELTGGGRVLVMDALRVEDGWRWTPPQEEVALKRYVDAVISMVRLLEGVAVSKEEIATYQLQPFFRNEMVDDLGFRLLLEDVAMWRILREKFTKMAHGKRPEIMQRACGMAAALMDDVSALRDMQQMALSLKQQPENLLNHCDVRSDNVAWHEPTRRAVLVDWNWASLAPRGFGATEFLVDITRRGGDVTSWLGELNQELLAALVGMYAAKSLQPPISAGSCLREMQAEAAAAALLLYRAID